MGGPWRLSTSRPFLQLLFRTGVTLGISAPTARQAEGSNRRQEMRGREGPCHGMDGDHTLVLTEH